MQTARMARMTARIFFESLPVATRATGVQMRVLNYEEAAGRMGVVRRSLERLIARGEGPSVIHLSPRRRGILESDFEKWLISRRRAAPGEASSNEGRR
jgi:predicted DNA-binding transcriptional regulator AlpA